jgi:large subunit ribosomal protein L4e
MAARPVITVYDAKTKGDVKETVPLPAVLTAPIRLDIVRFVHDNLAKNKRQAYAVSEWTGHQHSAESWGTGRAVARIPRISGSGTGRAAQGAFGNMCRAGRMFAPTKIWRRWHRKVNLKQKRHAVAAAVAASAVPALVMARGHQIDQVLEIPLVLDGLEKIERTKDLLTVLQNYGAGDDLQRSYKSVTLRAGRGKSRNRRFTIRRGPLIVYDEENAPVLRSFRNIPGVDAVSVHKLSILKLAPGGTLGRFVIWSSGAFKALDHIFGSYTSPGVEKAGYQLLRPIISYADVTAIIKSEAVQNVLLPIKSAPVPHDKKKNPYKNKKAMDKLNPFYRLKRRLELIQARRVVSK